MSRISGHRAGRPGGFTLVELMVAMSLAMIIIAGVVTAYLFLGRNLTRLINIQQQEVKARRALKMFTQDMSSAIALTTSTDTDVVMTVPAPGTSVRYYYTAGANGTGTFSRVDNATSTTITLASTLTAFDFNYYNEAGTSVSSSPQSVKSVQFSYTSAVGTSLNGTRASYSTVSPRVVLRNKPALQ